ncbi:DUF3784 domain-containing protein [Lysinibacillus sp. NPDC097287]|uniref:DUF3784 domain-containing protein n=1 Tax=Lysinibacillus sp. NPDC097287 TaxID=3364144 RepID=UPI0037FEE682
MDTNLLIFGVILLIIGYLVGVKKQTWLLSGFNEKRVKDKGKLARLVGGITVVLGAFIVISGVVGVKPVEYIVMFVVVVMLSLVIFVNVKMVE